MAASPATQNVLLRRLRWLLYIVVSLFLLFFCVGYTLLTSTGIEGYFPLYPAIDTVFAPDYSEEGFQQIKIGDNVGRVLELVGPPYGGCCPSTRSTWEYSSDGAFCCFDFAWLDRRLNFNGEGLVSEIISEVEHD
jgi:hypothetical protein